MVYTTSDKAVSPEQFALNRVIRIVPMYWGLTIALFAVAFVAPSLLQNTRADWGELVLSLLFIPFEKSGGLVQPLLFLGWTLNYEMFFYALFALSLFIGSAHKRVAVMSGTLILLVLFGQIVRPASVVAAFYTNPILLEFLYGVMIGAYYLKTKNAPPRLAVAVGALAVAALLLAVQFTVAPDWDRSLSWGIPAALIVLGSLILEAHGFVYRGKSLLLLGAASYMLYLTHPFAFIPIDKLAKRVGMIEGNQIFLVIIIELAVTVAIGIAVHLWLERPVTEYIRRRLSSDTGRLQWRNARALWPWYARS